MVAYTDSVLDCMADRMVDYYNEIFDDWDLMFADKEPLTEYELKFNKFWNLYCQ